MLPSTLYSLNHVTFLATKFEVATSNGSGGYAFTRNGRTHGWTDGRMTDRLWYEINIPFFLKKIAGINIIAAHIWNIVNRDDML